LEKSKTESEGFLGRVLLKFRVQSATRPSLSEREKGAKGTFRGRLSVLVLPALSVLVESGGPHPSRLNGTTPTSRTPTIVKDRVFLVLDLHAMMITKLVHANPRIRRLQTAKSKKNA
jgi:hypothetical protein